MLLGNERRFPLNVGQRKSSEHICRIIILEKMRTVRNSISSGYVMYVNSQSTPKNCLKDVTCIELSSQKPLNGERDFKKYKIASEHGDDVKPCNKDKCLDVKNSSKTKRVRFADEDGGQLYNVKIFNSIPSLYKPKLDDSENIVNFHEDERKSKVFKNISNYTLAYNETRLLLKNICVVGFGLVSEKQLFGAIAVRNLAYEKEIIVRVTFDNWNTYKDIQASYIQQEYGGIVDRFFFITKFYEYNPRHNIEFAVCYKVHSFEYWDNNGGNNYGFAKPNNSSLPS